MKRTNVSDWDNPRQSNQKIPETEEMIIGIEAETIQTFIGGKKKIITLRITTDNYRNSFVVDYDTGKYFRIGQLIRTKRENLKYEKNI